MNRLALLLCSCLALFPSVYADGEQPPQIGDSIRLDEVIVTGTMPKVNLRNLPMSVSIVGEGEIRNRLEPSLLPLLTEEVPGLFITQRGTMGYGVAAGAAGGMSIRGIGGTPTSGLLVLIDGHPQFMGLMGHPLADSYQSVMTERVEVVRGPASVLYGSNAMGGVINIITRKPKQEGTHHSVRFMYGSHQTLSSEAYGGWKGERLYLNGNIGLNRSEGHRENMGFEQLSGYGKAGYNINPNWSSFVDFNISNTQSSNPGTVSSPLSDNDADVTRGMSSFSIENEYDRTSGAIRFYYNFGRHKINDGYLAGEPPKPYRFHSTDRMLGFSLFQSYTLFEGNKTTAGVDFQRFGGKAENRYSDGSDNAVLADIQLDNIAGYLNLQQSLLENSLTLNVGIRLDNHEENGSEWIPQLGLSYTPSPTSVIKGIVSKGFRNPTIREMYMFPPQNPDLLPERLMNYELSFMHALPGNRLDFGINLYYIKGENMIQAVPVEGRRMNLNAGRVENRGIEINARYLASREIRLSANYSLLEMTHKLLAAPEHKLHLGATYTKRKWNLSTGLQYIGNLYIAITPQPVRESFLLWNARIHYRALDWLTLFLKGENLLGEEYEINAGYPMPKTTAFGGFQLQF
jgi:iron complex outermembrane receptor protein